ncbi:MAG: PIG-L family deacetylase, partial [Elusimicrobia bacterium]|nr:PIG-L family deacetylase [Elusimicrobiota bacterium]
MIEKTLERKAPRRADSLSKYAGATVMAVGAHPDDLELGCGGTLARLSRAGARVVMVVVSIPSSLRSRRAEAIRAAEILGCEIRFLTPNRCSRVEDL